MGLISVNQFNKLIIDEFITSKSVVIKELKVREPFRKANQ